MTAATPPAPASHTDTDTDPSVEVADHALLAAYSAGDPQAAAALMGRHLPWLLRFASRMLGGDQAEAEDVAQEAMLRLWRAAPGWTAEGAQPRTWLYRVAANLATDRLRRRGRQRPLQPADDPPDPGATALAGLIAADRARALNAALGHLPARQRQAMVLRHLEGLANPQIAQIMDCGVEAVESLLARGRRALAAELAPQRGDLGYEDEDEQP